MAYQTLNLKVNITLWSKDISQFYRWFEYFILACILINSIILAMVDYSDRDGTTLYNKVLNNIGSAFSLIFLIEALIKILAMGLIFHPNAYLRDPWNILDFIIVITG
jgi:hypothetical protein